MKKLLISLLVITSLLLPGVVVADTAILDVNRKANKEHILEVLAEFREVYKMQEIDIMFIILTHEQLQNLYEYTPEIWTPQIGMDLYGTCFTFNINLIFLTDTSTVEVIAHEISHAYGANEEEARVIGKDFERRYNLKRMLPDVSVVEDSSTTTISSGV